MISFQISKFTSDSTSFVQEMIINQVYIKYILAKVSF